MYPTKDLDANVYLLRKVYSRNRRVILTLETVKYLLAQLRGVSYTVGITVNSSNQWSSYDQCYLEERYSSDFVEETSIPKSFNIV